MLKLLKYVVALLLVVFIIVLGYVAVTWHQFIDDHFNRNTTIVLRQGASLKALARELEHQRLIAHPKYFELLGRIQGVSHKLKAGEYNVSTNMTPAELLSNMVAGVIVEHEFTIVEGWTFKVLKQQLLADKHLQHRLSTLSDLQLLSKLGSNYHHPEGLFFPDTYQYHWGQSDVDILQRAYNKMQQVLRQQWQARARRLPYKNAYSALIMASIIEKETALDSERARISGVLVRRLKKVMHLGVDPTVVYGLGQPYGYRLTRKDLRTKTPYNTYLNYGLPPTPIDMPGLASIIAAMHPDHGTSLYYVSRNNGSHVFSDTYAQHLRAVNKYQR